jgi:Holliday junction resolvase RusA-like endonuclease
MPIITLTIPGPPVGKQRARVTRTGHAYTPPATVNYEALVKQTFAAKYPDFVPMAGPVRMGLWIMLMPSKETARKIKKGIKVYPTIKPDVDNVLKIIADALSGLAFVDDKQIVESDLSKHYAERPMVEVVIKELT